MAVTQDMVMDLIQILPDRQIQVRQTRRFLDDDGVVIGTGPYHRFVLDPGVHKVEDIAALNEDLFNIATVTWTPEIVSARKAFLAEQDVRTQRNLEDGQHATTLPLPPKQP